MSQRGQKILRAVYTRRTGRFDCGPQNHWPSCILALLCVLVLLAACQVDVQVSISTPQVAPTQVVASTVASPSQSVTPELVDSGWTQVTPGVEMRHWRVLVDANLPLADLVAARFDPAQVRFHMGYKPGQPPTFDEWTTDARPLAAINGGFFSETYQSTALVISNSAASGTSYVGRGGMFWVDSSGHIGLRSLADQPYDSAEPLVEAMQSWPILVKPGGVPAYNGDDPDRARRSVVALDRDGHVLLLVCASSTFTLRALSDWLGASDLAIDSALNLDGGSSTGLYVDGEVRVAPFGRLPLVLLADRR